MPIVEVPVGPQHPALHEPILLRVFIEGDVVTRVDISTGYNHRGIEKLAESNPWLKTLYIVSRVCGICNIAHSTCYVQALEMLNSIRVPERALALRTIVLELERLHSHMLLAAVFAEIIGLESLFMLLMRDREVVMQLKELITGNRVLADFVTPGGVKRDIDDHTVELVKRRVRWLRERLTEYLRVFEEDALIARRSEEVGVVSYADAVSHSLVGPVARASGVDFDARRDVGYAWYDNVDFKVVVRREGDAKARMLVRLEEAIESTRIIEAVLDGLPSGPVLSLRVPPRVYRRGWVLSVVEAPRGELIYHVFSDGGRTPYRVKIRTPSIPNILNTGFAYVGYTLSDVPVILASFDPCISCMERVVVVNERGERRLVSIRRLARGESR